MIVGEPQILGQLKQAYSAAREAGALNGTLNETRVLKGPGIEITGQEWNWNEEEKDSRKAIGIRALGMRLKGHDWH